MRKILIKYSVAVTAFALLTTPAAALGIGDLAKVVLGNGSVLKKGEEKCGTSLGLTKKDSLAMTFAPRSDASLRVHFSDNWPKL